MAHSIKPYDTRKDRSLRDLLPTLIKVREPLCNRLVHHPRAEEAAAEGRPVALADLKGGPAAHGPQRRAAGGHQAALLRRALPAACLPPAALAEAAGGRRGVRVARPLWLGL